jgi:Na+-driven multidrug efflux pump
LRLLGAGGPVLTLARSYISIIIVFNVLSCLSVMLSSIIRADGNPVFSSAVSIGSAVLNIALDPAFIFGFGPVPAMGIEGAATATVVSQAVGTAIFTFHLLSRRTGYRFRPAYFIPHLFIIIDIYRVGAASIVRSGAQFLVMGIINNTAASFGMMPLAIMGVLVRAGRFIQMPVLGLGQGMIPVIGYNYGAGRKNRVTEILFKMTLSGSLWTLLCWLAMMVFPGQVMSIFGDEKGFLADGTQAIRLYSLALFSLGLRMVPGFFFQGIGKGMPATVLTATQNVVFLLLPVLILPRYLGLAGLWTAFPLADILALAFGQIWMNRVLRRQGIRFFWWKSETGANHKPTPS